jgi:hypothetical protein
VESAWTRGYESGYEDGNDEPTQGTVRSQGYTRATAAGSAIKELGDLDHDKLLNVVWAIFLSNPVAKRYLQIKRDYILGRGVQPTTEDEALQELLDAFWIDNDLDRRLRKFVLQWRLFGEQCYPVFVRESDGRVRLGYFDPTQIEDVILHPENALEKWAVVIKRQNAAKVKNWQFVRRDKQVYRIVRRAEPVVMDDDTVATVEHEGRLVTWEQTALEPWEEKMLADHGLKEYTGTCFYFTVNDVANQKRGYSDLLQVVDWLDQLDNTLFSLADREELAALFSWDVTLKDADEPRVKERARQIRKNPPKRGSFRVHNDKEAWEMKIADLKQIGTVQTEKALLIHSLGGLGMPHHWYGYGDDTNRATAHEQNQPSWRTMEHDQDETKDAILFILQFVRDQALIARIWSGEADVDLQMPEMSGSDIKLLSESSGQLAVGLATAKKEGWITTDTAAEVWATLMAELGVTYVPSEEVELAKAEQDAKPPPLPPPFMGQQTDSGTEPDIGEENEQEYLEEVMAAASAAPFPRSDPWGRYP